MDADPNPIFHALPRSELQLHPGRKSFPEHFPNGDAHSVFNGNDNSTRRPERKPFHDSPYAINADLFPDAGNPRKRHSLGDSNGQDLPDRHWVPDVDPEPRGDFRCLPRFDPVDGHAPAPATSPSVSGPLVRPRPSQRENPHQRLDRPA